MNQLIKFPVTSTHGTLCGGFPKMRANDPPTSDHNRFLLTFLPFTIFPEISSPPFKSSRWSEIEVYYKPAGGKSGNWL